MKQDLIAIAAILTMFIGVLLLPSTSLGLLLIAIGGAAMLLIILKVMRAKN